MDRLGYRAELWNRPAQFHELEDEASDAGSIEVPWRDREGQAYSLRVPAWIAASRCRVCLGVAKTHGVFRVGLGLANLGSVLSLDSGGSWAAGLVESWRGSLMRGWLGMRTVGRGMRLTGPERRRLEAVERATDGLVALAAVLMPTVSLIDGFVAAQGDGPRHGRRASLRTIIAGTDAVAVDAVAAAVMGFEPLEIAYLRLAQARGLGTADLGAIAIVGDPISPPRRSAAIPRTGCSGFPARPQPAPRRHARISTPSGAASSRAES